MADCTPAKQMIRLVTLDEGEFMATVALATMSQRICNLIADGYTEISILVPHVTAGIVRMVIEYCEIHVFKQKRTRPCTAPDGSPIMLTEKEIENWDRKFVNVHRMTIYGLIVAASFLKIPGLFDLACGQVEEKLRRGLKVMSAVDTYMEERITTVTASTKL